VLIIYSPTANETRAGRGNNGDGKGRLFRGSLASSRAVYSIHRKNSKVRPLVIVRLDPRSRARGTVFLIKTIIKAKLAPVGWRRQRGAAEGKGMCARAGRRKRKIIGCGVRANLIIIDWRERRVEKFNNDPPFNESRRRRRAGDERNSGARCWQPNRPSRVLARYRKDLPSPFLLRS